MIGRRAADEASPGFVSVIMFLALMAFAAWILTVYPPEKVATPKPIDACKDGILQSWDGYRWHPVTIPRQSHHYDGKKWAPDHPAGHVRTIPCKEEE